MITISLCVIVRNEEAVLARMLESAAPFADEILIADTGSTDQTRRIAARYATRLFDFPWQDDFAAARNFICSKASMDYWMWLDADDVVPPASAQEILRLKETLDPSIDLVMMKYVTARDENGRPAFSYDRERLVRNGRGYRWAGRVHEAVTPKNSVLRLPIVIEHRKERPGDPNRNLRIYEAMIREGEALNPRHQYYYGRELAAHGRFEEAARVLKHFLTEPDGWIENRIDACLQLSFCLKQSGQRDAALAALFSSFRYGTPRAPVCCAAGLLFLEAGKPREAAFWYRQALADRPGLHPDAFTQAEFYDFVPLIQLCVCYDRLGNLPAALYCHRKCRKLRPNHPSVLYNERYFRQKANAQNLFGSHIIHQA